MSTLPGSITLSSTSVFLPLLGTLSSWSHPTCPLLNLYLDREFLVAWDKETFALPGGQERVCVECAWEGACAWRMESSTRGLQPRGL